MREKDIRVKVISIAGRLDSEAPNLLDSDRLLSLPRWIREFPKRFLRIFQGVSGAHRGVVGANNAIAV